MSKLDDLKYIDKLDKSDCLQSIEFLPDQISSAWQDVKKISFPDSYREVTSVIFCGMGGSAYGGRIIESLFNKELKIPLKLVDDYNLPGFVNENSLIISSSYSGNTEETLSNIKQAFKLNLKMVGIASGGKLVEVLKGNNHPVYNFDPKFNPSNQPRLGQGYMQMGQIAILNALGLLNIEDKEVYSIINMLKTNTKYYKAQSIQSENIAKQKAFKVQDKIVNLIGAEFLAGAIHAIRNPFNETGKHFANYFIVPELNHHLLDGLMFPLNLQKNTIFLIIDSDLYSPLIKERMQLTKQVVEKNNIEAVKIQLKGKTKIEQNFELIQLGSFITFYLAILHGINPAPIPWVDFFKKKLKERR